MRCFPLFIVWQRPKLLLYWKFETDILENRKMRQKHFDWPFTFFLSCFRTNFVRTFQSHFYNFSNCQTLLPLKHLCLLSFEYKACKLQVAILFYSISQEVSKSFSLSQIFRQRLSQREDIYISFQFSLIAQDVQTALEHSIAGCWCSRFLFSLFAGFIF